MLTANTSNICCCHELPCCFVSFRWYLTPPTLNKFISTKSHIKSSTSCSESVFIAAFSVVFMYDEQAWWQLQLQRGHCWNSIFFQLLNHLRVQIYLLLLLHFIDKVGSYERVFQSFARVGPAIIPDWTLQECHQFCYVPFFLDTVLYDFKVV